MTNNLFYLKQNVLAEPLFNQWYAWSHLISPQTAAMNIANSHVKIMKSYVNAPQIHANAVLNPKMLGGPFIDYEGKRVDEIKALLDRTTREQAHMIDFAASVKTLDDMLRNEAKGYSVEPLYARAPENLKGYVELVYDLNNNPSIRFIEGLLYKSKYYQPRLQSLSLSLIERDDRPFALSTPRLPSEKVLELSVPFNDPRVDALFRMKHEPRPLGELLERFKLTPDQTELFTTFFTTNEPRPTRKYDGAGVRIRYFGHACVMVETRDVTILIDPAISYYYENGIERFTFQDLPEKIDYVLLTHAHQDHVMFETLLQIKHKVKNVVIPRSRGGCLEDPSLKLILEMTGFSNIIEVQDMERIEIEGGSITGLPFLGEHGDLNITSKVAHLIELRGKTFLFAADSNNLESAVYDHILDVVGHVNVLFLGMECDGAPMSWLYGQLLTKPIDRKMDQTRRFSGSNHERGIGIIDRFRCEDVYVYAMGQEPWLTYVVSIKYTDESNPIVESNKLVAECRSRGINSERLFGMKELFYCE